MASQLVKTSKRVSRRSQEERIKQERIHDILLLLKHLFEREEATVKIVLDCLYDVGSINLINQKVPFRPLNQVLKSITKMSKPVFRVVALRWFKQNCPQLIVDWLKDLVTFKDSKEKVVSEIREIQVEALPEIETYSREIKHLRSQVRVLVGISVVAIAVLTIVSLS